MTRNDLERALACIEGLSAKLESLLEARPRIVIVTHGGRVVSVRSNHPMLEVDVLDLDGIEADDPPRATTGSYPFEVDIA